eukprot:scaffold98938_cov23-Tisochrysis_lutea.AAC.1
MGHNEMRCLPSFPLAPPAGQNGVARAWPPTWCVQTPCSSSIMDTGFTLIILAFIQSTHLGGELVLYEHGLQHGVVANGADHHRAEHLAAGGHQQQLHGLIQEDVVGLTAGQYTNG